MNNIRPIKSLGQNFLQSIEIARKIVEQLEIETGDSVIEIGPGPGILTDILLKNDIHLTAVELDIRAYELLISRYAKQVIAGQLKLVNSDFLDYEFTKNNLKVIGNIPYYISNDIVFKLLENFNSINSAVMTVQKEVAERLAANPNNKQYGVTSIALKFFGEAEIMFDIPPEAFYPSPRVTSSVIRINFNRKYEDVDFKKMMGIVKKAFNQRRKKLSNSIADIFGQFPDDEMLNTFRDKRAENLSLEDYVYIYNLIYSK